MKDRIPTLDGWRGIAILLVLVTHAQAGMLGHTIMGQRWLVLGWHGVWIFFVLSGYLITSRLLAEDKIDLRHFYMRRFFRLMPIAWCYLAFIGFFSILTGIRLIGVDLWSCLFFFRNYFPFHETTQNALTSHFWSLSLEEQFYLFWPAILAFAGRRRALYFAIFATIASATYRSYVWTAYDSSGRACHSEINLDGLLLGCILAVMLQHEPIRNWIVRNHRWLLLVGLASLALHIAYFNGMIPLSESVTIMALIACTSLNPSHWLSRMLEWKHLKFVGVISYSLYIWQEFFVVAHLGLVGLAILPAAAILSWTYIEQPGIRLGRRFSDFLDARRVRLEAIPNTNAL